MSKTDSESKYLDRAGSGPVRRAVGYIRVSTEEQIDGYSLDAQRAAIERYCELNGYRLIWVYADEGVSGRTDHIAKRPELKRLLDDAKQGQFDIVIVHTLDRWARNIRVQSNTLEILGKAEVGFVSVTENFDFTSAAGRLMLTMMGGVSQFFSDQLGVRVSKAFRERAERGLQNGSVPFGYDKDPETGVGRIVPDEAEAVRTAFAMRAAGDTSEAIARWLNSKGFKTGRGKSFIGKSVRDILASRYYVGVVTYAGEEFPGQHEAIIETELFDKVQARKVRRGATVTNRTARPPLLGGLARCGRCMGRLEVDRNGSGSAQYRERHRRDCETNHRSSVALPFDEQVRVIFLSMEVPQDWREQIARLSVRDEGPSVSDLQKELRRIARAYGDGGYTDEEYDHKKEEIEAQLRMADYADTVEVDDVATLLQNLPDLWEGATPIERQRLLRTLVQAVYIDIESKCVVGIEPLPAFRTLLESGIAKATGLSVALVSPDEIGDLENVELVETGENRTPRPASLRHGSATGVVSSRFSPASHR